MHITTVNSSRLSVNIVAVKNECVVYAASFRRRCHDFVVSKSMSLLRHRTCPDCRGEMHPQLINMVYTKAQSDLHIEVIGIPANVCTQCHFRLIPGKVAKYIDTLIDPIFESDRRQQEKILPTPHIDIHFPPLDRALYAA